MPTASEFARDLALALDPSPVTWIDAQIRQNELGQPFQLFAHQRVILRRAFAFDEEGRLPYDTILYSCIKKSGKTTLNAAVTLWWAMTQEAPNEILLIANDLEQAQGRVFAAIEGLLTHNPAIDPGAEVLTKEIRRSNGMSITAIASEYAGAAGSNHGLTSWDELWGYTSERARRLWEELTPVPTRKNSIRFITTYAGWDNESALLWDLYRHGVDAEEHRDGQAVRLDPELPIYENPGARLFVYWDHEPRMPWQTGAYYASQRRTLRAGSYLRLHSNHWTTTESTFITAELWDPCVNPVLSPLMPTRQQALFMGVDAGIKHDTAAVMGVHWAGEKLVLASHRIWHPSPGEPLDLEAMIEAYLRGLHQGYHVKAILYDPYPLHRSISTLQAAHLPIREFPQMTANTTLMGQTLFDLLHGRNLVCYTSAELRQQALNTVAIEKTRGWRIAKEKASKKIDAIVALAMACVAAIQGKPQGGPRVRNPAA